jgi:DNA (cytosine-5)-methyltransferase 1
MTDDVAADAAMRIGSLFSGYGGLEQAVHAVLGGETAWVSDIDPGACKILAHRYPDVPNLGDITTVDWSQVEPVDVLTGGFPCQDVSSAGKRAGLNADTRSGLWAQMARAIDELRPPLVVIENVRGLLSACALSELEPCPRCLGDESQPHRPVLRALGRVLGDLAFLGYDARWGGLRAADVGAPHGRFRVFVAAWPAADAHGDAVREQPVTVSGRGGSSITGQPGADVAPHANGAGLGRLEELHAAPEAGHGASDRHDVDGLTVVARGVDWGVYTAAVRRWERLTRPAPNPTERGKNGQPRLSPAFVEWMQGLPAGWVTDVPGLSRNEQLKALGNGVVPQQAAAALRLLLPDALEAAA